ncbi:MAG: carboxypeptidase-like regulatory domain-containing protein [Lewinellaceae bacterium]|nr:carboxypeptidase-like regulatory domain-containing protein [Lewinellaceae bacterium]
MRLLIFCFVICWVNLSAQITLSGVVADQSNNRPLPFANVFTDTGEGGITSESGKFIIEVKAMPAKLTISYVGYETKVVQLKAGTLFYPVKIAPISMQLMQINVLATDENAAAFFLRSHRKFKKSICESPSGKNVPADLFHHRGGQANRASGGILQCYACGRRGQVF